MTLNYIKIKYISPVSQYKFSNGCGCQYLLIFIETNDSNIPYIHRIIIKDINNITESVRAYSINRNIKLTAPHVSIKLFELMNHKITLLFSGKIDFTKARTPTIIKLHTPTFLNSVRTDDYIGNKTFLNEKFNNFMERSTKSYCLLFIDIITPQKKIILPQKVALTDSNDTPVYNRYTNNLMIEYVPKQVKNNIWYNHQNKHKNNIKHFITSYCNNHTTFHDYANIYPVDTNQYYKYQQDKVTSKSQRILKDLRPSGQSPYHNNLIMSPTDGRTKGFTTHKDIKFTTYFNQLSLPTDTYTPESGFITRVAPQDYHTVIFPYSGNITKITNNSNHLNIEVTNTYYIPPSVSERDYLSVFLGHYTNPTSGVGAATRNYPELLQPQPNIVLKYNLIITKSDKYDSLKMMTKLTVGQWVNTGKEICDMFCGGGVVIFLCNRLIEFASDMKKPIDTFIKMNDVVGALH